MTTDTRKTSQKHGHSNGPEMVIGETYFVPGLDMDCDRVVVLCTLIELRPRKEIVGYDGTVHWQDCITNAAGINMLDDSRTLYASASEALAGQHHPSPNSENSK